MLTPGSMMARWLSCFFTIALLAGCAADKAKQDKASLENTYWKLVRVGDGPVGSGPGQREPHLILRRQDHRVSGFTGCNQMAGGYSLDGQTLSFTQMISTKMACLGGGMDTEAQFTAALQQVHGRRQADALRCLGAVGDRTGIARTRAEHSISDKRSCG